MRPVGNIREKSTFVLGVDFARMGEDSTAFIVLEQPAFTDEIFVVYIEETRHKKLTDPIGRVLYLHNKFKFNKIYLDCTGLGAGPVDVLNEKLGSHKIEPITFTNKSKEDMYGNLTILFETKKLKIPNHKKLIYQLADLRRELKSDGKIKIHHADRGHDDLPDALALACLHFRPKRRGAYRIIPL